MFDHCMSVDIFIIELVLRLILPSARMTAIPVLLPRKKSGASMVFLLDRTAYTSLCSNTNLICGLSNKRLGFVVVLKRSLAVRYIPMTGFTVSRASVSLATISASTVSTSLSKRPTET